jgi:hypothetical protein
MYVHRYDPYLSKIGIIQLLRYYYYIIIVIHIIMFALLVIIHSFVTFTTYACIINGMAHWCQASHSVHSILN